MPIGCRSGIYEIACKNCDKVYIGQIKRSIETRYKEHVAHFRFVGESSTVAQHLVKAGYHIEKVSI